MKYWQLLFLLTCSLCSSSCIMARDRLNKAIDQEAYGRLEPGVSKEADVLRELGAPADVVQLGKRSAWRYDHTQSKSAAFWPILFVFANRETQQDRVWVFFDANGLLTNRGGTFHAEEASYKMPWSD